MAQEVESDQDAAPADRPVFDLQGRICVISGATSGIGKITATGLASLGAHVVILCRDATRGDAAVRDIRAISHNNQVSLVIADLASRQSTTFAANELKRTLPRIDILINNAATMTTGREVTTDGWEQTFAVNYLNPALLTILLLESLRQSTAARVINVADEVPPESMIHWDDLHMARQPKFDPLVAYCHSKLALIMFTYALAQRTYRKGLTVNCLTPGDVNTPLAQRLYGRSYWLKRFFMPTPEQGAQTTLYLAASPEVEHTTCKFFARSQVAPSARQSYDAQAQDRLWVITMKQLGLPVTLK